MDHDGNPGNLREVEGRLFNTMSEVSPSRMDKMERLNCELLSTIRDICSRVRRVRILNGCSGYGEGF